MYIIVVLIEYVYIGIIFYCIGIPNGTCTTLSRNLTGCSTVNQRVLQADWLILENNEKATLSINMPYSDLTNSQISSSLHTSPSIEAPITHAHKPL